jgi:hypothetical protein
MTLALPPGSLALQPLSRIRQEENCQVEILFGRALWKLFLYFAERDEFINTIDHILYWLLR